MTETIRYRGQKILYEPGFVRAYRWLGTVTFKTLAEAKVAIDRWLS